MKRINLLLIFLFAFTTLFGQEVKEEFKPSGRGIGTIFFFYGHNLDNDADQRSAFVLERAYLGYGYNFTKTVSAKVIFDVGYDSTVKTYTAYAKNAMLDWTFVPKAKLSVGLIGCKQFDTQESFWAHRYVLKTFADQYSLGTSADLGFNFEINPSDKWMFNVFMLNGDGYKALQDADGLHRYGANVIAKPTKGLILKLHYDFNPSEVEDEDVTITNFTAFAGYAFNERATLGLEYNFLNNGENFRKPFEDKSLGGISIYGSYKINNKYEVFGRYDNLQSNELDGETENWNYGKDGSLILIGAQYNITKLVDIALNYKGWNYDDPDINNASGIFLNLGASFK